MSHVVVLEKILKLNDQKKKEMQLEHAEAIKSFEKVATKLYAILKKKETAELTLSKYMKQKATIDKLQEQSMYIYSLTDDIEKLQQEVQRARQYMEEKQKKLTEAHVEVKKIETLIENRLKELEETERKQETVLMDEISLQQHFSVNR